MVMKELRCAERGYTNYPPFVLVVSDSSARAIEVKGSLENNGCQVDWADLTSGGLAIACSKYFDLIVLKLEQPGANYFEAYEKLRAYPQLIGLPVAILMTHDDAGESRNGPKRGNVYYLSSSNGSPGDTSAEEKLLRIIEQVHYLNYRYM